MENNRQQLRLAITNHTNQCIGEPLFITGTFNNWRPGALAIGTIPPVGESCVYVLHDLSEEPLEFKLTRGDWSTLNATKNGKLAAPYVAQAGRDSTLEIQIDGWRDQFPCSTASPQVHVLAEAFFLSGMGVSKKIWIYIPKGYESTDKRYPVIYMHDGQYLFDEATSQGKAGPVEWEVDEVIDNALQDAIVVGIASARDDQTRKDEYLVNPTDHTMHPQGHAYLAAIVSTLKPFIDQTYRTLPGAAHTAMVGSSLGGLLTLYGGLLYPEVFGSLGIFSPSIWMDDQQQLTQTIESALQRPNQHAQKQHLYLYGGQLEERTGANPVPVKMIEYIRYFSSMLQADDRFEIQMDINPLGRHGAWYWQSTFPKFYQWWQKTLL